MAAFIQMFLPHPGLWEQLSGKRQGGIFKEHEVIKMLNDLLQGAGGVV